MANEQYHFFPGGAHAALLREFPWETTPLGPPAAWPVPLQTLVGVMLGAAQPMFVAWGPRRTLICNEACARILGNDLPPLGRDLLEAWGQARAQLAPLVAAVYAGQPVHSDARHLVLQRDGDPQGLHLSYAFSPIRDEAGAVQGLFCACDDRTAQLVAEREAARAAERVQLALDAGAIIGTWVWDVPANHFVADARFARSFGLDEELCRLGLPIEQVFRSVHSDDVPTVQQAIAEAMGRGGPYRCEYRVRQQDGIYRWIEANGRVELDGHGVAVRFPGVLLDISERRRAQAERDSATALLRTFIDAVPGVVYAKDREGRLLMANRGTAELLGRPAEDFIGRTDAEVLADQAQAEAIMANDRRIMASGLTEEVEEAVHQADGTPAWWHSTKTPWRDAQGAVIGLVGSSIEITDRKRQQEENARLYAQARQAAAERDQLLESERAARAEAERASRLKDEFLATLSHELRTPLSAIMGWAHVLRQKLGSDPTLLRGVDVIERSTRVQTQLIEDLLDMSRIDAGKLALDMRPLAPAPLVEAAVDSIRPTAMAAGVSVAVLSDEAAPLVLADAARLQQVLWNLLTNAVKFSQRGGTVSVRLGAEQGWLRLDVQDAGVGIRPEFLPHVFERFRQADGSTTRRFGGLGLGLAIVRQLVELHGGTITAASEGEGQGACFSVRLPPHSLLDEAFMRPVGAGLHLDLDGLAVLVVDDEPDVLELLTRILREANARVFSACDALTALDLLQTERPALMVSDIGMPQLDGYELARRLRRLPPQQGGGIPAIALTAFARPEDRARALDAGFTLHLSKPIDPANLLASIARLAAFSRV